MTQMDSDVDGGRKPVGKALFPRARTNFFLMQLMRLLAEQDGPMRREQIRDTLARSLNLSDSEKSVDVRGRDRWWVNLGFYGIGLVKAGYLTRAKGLWAITPAGRKAIATMSEDELFDDAKAKYDEWLANRVAEEGDEEESGTGVMGNTHTPRIWMVGTGHQGVAWPDFRDNERIAVSLQYDGGELGDLSLLTEDQVRSKLKSLTGAANPYNRVLCAVEFSKQMKEGDLVIARSGRQVVHGLGIVRGPYRYAADRTDLKHERAVEWIATHERVLPDGYSNPTKALTDMTPYPSCVDVVFGKRTAAALEWLASKNLSVEEINTFFLQDPYVLPEESNVSDPTQGLDDPPSLKQIDDESFLNFDELKEIVDALKSKKAVVLQGSPGTGKSYLAEKLAHMHAGSRSRVMKVQFHPAYSYEDFIRGIRPRENGAFGVENGTLVQMALRAQREPNQRFVLILDEINRANVAKVMGEALSLIESDKRDVKHAVQLGLAHEGKREFYMPPNLCILATMNTADRSIALVDYALRRRFAFFTLQPAFDRPEFRQWLLEAFGADEAESEADARGVRAEARRVTDRIVSMMTQVNNRIREHKALGPNYLLGHSFFCTYEARLGDSPTEWARRVLKTEIVPLLKEYAVEHPRLQQELLDLIRE